MKGENKHKTNKKSLMLMSKQLSRRINSIEKRLEIETKTLKISLVIVPYSLKLLNH